jgi:CHAD domain-containing protein
MTPPTETEFKLRATRPTDVALVDAALRELGVAVRTATSGSHVDHYLDDAGGSLAANGIGLRLRRAADGHRLACKAAARAVDGRFVRDEHEASWAGDEPPRNAQHLPDPLRDRVEPFVLDRPLLPVLQLSTRRDVRLLVHDDEDLCELTVDRVEASAGGATVAFQGIELAVAGELAANERHARALLERLPLEPAVDDEPSHAASLLGLRPRVATPAGDTIADALGGAVARHVVAMRAAEVGVRAAVNQTSLHAMRVAVRRLRSLVRAFRDLWPDDVATRAQEQLGADGRTLGEVRDLDVLLASLHGDRERVPEPLRPAAARAIAWIRTQRDDADQRLQRWLRAPERLRAQGQLERDLQALDRSLPAAARSAAAAVAERVAAASERLRKRLAELPPELPLEPLHAVRIAAKRVRYVAEELADGHGDDHAKALARITALQQALGEVCDHELAGRRLLAWLAPAAAACRDGADGDATAAALGALAMHHAARAAKARKRARRAIERADRKRVWRALHAGDAASAGDPS